MPRTIVVTSALPYANGPIHIGHLVEYLQTDIWVRFQKECGNKCYYFCADDTHGTPIMISARKENIAPEKLIERAHSEHFGDFKNFLIEFDNYYSTHSPENKHFSELIFERLKNAGSIVVKTIKQTYCESCKMDLPDRYVKGTCPKCKSDDQYGDSCDKCGATYQPTDLINPQCSVCGNPPSQKDSQHYFFKVSDYEKQIKDIFAKGYIQQSVANKMEEWFADGLKDWDISRDGPYFGFKIPGEDNKYFYVWLDAPIGYLASAKNYCDRNGMDFEKLWNNKDVELYHFIGKDIMYFHALFFPATLIGSQFKTANKLFVHGFLTVNGEKMSKSKGTFIKASTYFKHLDPEYLRYYYASKLTGGVEDIGLSIEDFINKINSDLVGKFANLASRSGPMLTKNYDSQLGTLDDEGRGLLKELAAAKDEIIENYERLDFAAAVRIITALADKANKYVEVNQPWTLIKTDAEKTKKVLTAIINSVKIITTYLKPILPSYTKKIEKFLNAGELSFSNIDVLLENHRINPFERLIDRIEKEKVEAMVEESKDSNIKQTQQPVQTPVVPATAPAVETAEITIDDFMKVDLRIAKVLEASKVEGADKLLQLKLDLGDKQKNIFAGIATAYDPQTLVGKMIVCVANLKPRKMKFGMSEGMALAAGDGGKEIFLLTADAGVKPGQRVK